MKQFTSLHDATLPALEGSRFDTPTHEKLSVLVDAEHPPRILQRLGAETRVSDPHGLPLPDSVPADHPKAAELRALSL